MNKIKFLFFLLTINLSYASDSHPAEHSGGWLDKWLTIDVGLLLWTILTFMVLLLVLRWKAWGPLMTALDARADKITESLSKAEQVTLDAEKQAEKNEAILNQARKEAQEIVVKARDAGDKLKNKLETEGKSQYENMLVKAKEQINTEKEKALNEIKTTVVDIALQASEKIIKRNLTNEDNKKMIEDTIDQLKQSN